jgi:hypothetical protein
MRGDDRTVWLFWEGACPPYVQLCLNTILRHHPDAVLLDRAGFEALRTTDRDLALDGLSLNHLSDYVRAWLLAHRGGFYIDADCILLRPIEPLFDMAAVHGFVGYREPQGYMSCNFMGAAPRSVVAADHYLRVAERIRAGGTLRWLDLASSPMDQAVAAVGEGALILPTRSIMPVAWNESARLLARRDDSDHAAGFPATSWCAMLSNHSIASDPATRHLTSLTERTLLSDRSFLSFLLRRGLGLPELEPIVTDGARFVSDTARAERLDVRIHAHARSMRG